MSINLPRSAAIMTVNCNYFVIWVNQTFCVHFSYVLTLLGLRRYNDTNLATYIGLSISVEDTQEGRIIGHRSMEIISLLSI